LVDVEQCGHGQPSGKAGFVGPAATSQVLIIQIKNIRFTNQSFRRYIRVRPPAGGIGWGFRVVPVPGIEANGLQIRTAWRLEMSANIPVLPIAGSALLRAFIAALAFATQWLKRLLRARRHRREANALARLDRHMLADIGITRSDLNDAFSEPFWEDPTALLRERASERRGNRPPSRPHDAPASKQVSEHDVYPQPAHRRALPMI
jgi:uncharacterized protein YjiS (DUF1127 family)